MSTPVHPNAPLIFAFSRYLLSCACCDGDRRVWEVTEVIVGLGLGLGLAEVATGGRAVIPSCEKQDVAVSG